jgi:hypothetical protein
MKRVITISYTVDSTDAKTIGRLVSPLIFYLTKKGEPK